MDCEHYGPNDAVERHVFKRPRVPDWIDGTNLLSTIPSFAPARVLGTTNCLSGFPVRTVRTHRRAATDVPALMR